MSLAGLTRRSGWLRDDLLSGENQFSLVGNAQQVVAPIMLDNQDVAPVQQGLARDAPGCTGLGGRLLWC
jgi:hypothetical protein